MTQLTEITVALAGNPNCGKSSLFNALTGSHQKVGNFSGVTIEKYEGYVDFKGYRIRFVDLPGTYSLTAYSPEELVTRHYLAMEHPDIVVNVIEGPNLERNLLLTTQLMEMEVELLVALNMYDEVEAQGMEIDVKQLQQLLGCHIIPTSAKARQGLDRLLDHIVRVYSGEIQIRKNKLAFRPEIEDAVKAVQAEIRHEPALDGRKYRWMALKLLENDREIYREVHQSPVWLKIERILQQAMETTGKLYQADPEILITEDRHALIRGAMEECVRMPEARKRSLTDYIDAVVLNRIIGLPVFFGVVWLIFHMTFTLGTPLMDALDQLFTSIALWVSPLLTNEMLRSVIVDGVIAGVGGVLVFLPNIILLFIGLSFLEASGYMARAAFVVDKVMHRFGLHGKSFIPMITGFGCSIPAIMATRTLKSPSDRLATIMIIPFMSCGAKLPVYVLLAGAFFPPAVAANVMFGIYMLGVLLGLLTALLLKSTILEKESEPFVMELPPYRWPTLSSVLFQSRVKAMMYLRKAGTVILLAVLLIWTASNFPKSAAIERDLALETARIEATVLDEEAKALELTAVENRASAAQLEYSMAGRTGKLIEPVIRPLGFDWRIGIALVTGLAAKEVVVSTMGTIYSLGDVDEEDTELKNILKHDPAFDQATALSLMVFVLLYIPCVAAIGVMKKEVGSWRPVLLYSSYALTVAWVFSFITYNVARLIL
ncbi:MULTISPECIES: ferrous iron transport protein B [Prosthecochloris]|uniref:Ferrous iron transport protein B n=1 Tax=Prosthecochloris vibrioformis TaxID=1098 RepID=A0A5C4S2Z6_PROVB|nr:MULTISPECIES: ferrous iron transport protein B [Prosthecochloris]ANT65952.1 Ferrous iron transport protein B [Prosthecochloris sp. CIB 2401]TNJ37705.1 ferrous iron transport protein B [Prosthecochloris vibrioformis]